MFILTIMDNGTSLIYNFIDNKNKKVCFVENMFKLVLIVWKLLLIW